MFYTSYCGTALPYCGSSARRGMMRAWSCYTVLQAMNLLRWLGVALLLGACADAGEEPHLRFCRQLILTQFAPPAAVVWTGQRAEARGYDGLTVVVQFTSGSPQQSHTGRCHYAYHAPDDTALTLADPLSAYASTPQALELDGQPLSREALARAIRDALLAQGRALVARARHGLGLSEAPPEQ